MKKCEIIANLESTVRSQLKHDKGGDSQEYSPSERGEFIHTDDKSPDSSPSVCGHPEPPKIEPPDLWGKFIRDGGIYKKPTGPPDSREPKCADCGQPINSKDECGCTYGDAEPHERDTAVELRERIYKNAHIGYVGVEDVQRELDLTSALLGRAADKLARLESAYNLRNDEVTGLMGQNRELRAECERLREELKRERGYGDSADQVADNLRAQLAEATAALKRLAQLPHGWEIAKSALAAIEGGAK